MATLTGTENADTLEGTGDNDTITGLGGADTITGAAGADSIDGGDGADDIDGGVGNDSISGGLGVDSLDGGEGDDRLNGGQDGDRLDGGVGADTLNGGQGSDNVVGGDGNDLITEDSNGDDKLFGGAGDDEINVSRAGVRGDKIQIDGGAGADTITYTNDDVNPATKINLIIDAGSGANEITVEAAKEITINSGGDADKITLDTIERAFVHSGGSADEISASAAAADAKTGISTGKGIDTLHLDINDDARFRLKLGEGQDVVTLTGEADGSVVSDFKVKVKDFAAGDTGDKIDIDAYLASVIDADPFPPNAFASGHLRLVQDGDDAVLQIDRDGAGTDFGFEDIVWFQDATAASFTAFNFDGLDPTPEAAGPEDFVV